MGFPDGNESLSRSNVNNRQSAVLTPSVVITDL